MKYFTVALLLLAFPSYGYEIERDEFQFIVEDTGTIVQMWGLADEDCRGQSGTLSMHLGCATREMLTDVLEHRGWCIPTEFGKRYWRQCNGA